MILKDEDIQTIRSVVLPEYWSFDKWHDPVRIKQLAETSLYLECGASPLQSRNERVNQIQLSFKNNESAIICSRKPRDLFGATARMLLVAQKPGRVENSVLHLPSKYVWINHPCLNTSSMAEVADGARTSWKNALLLVQEDPVAKRPGLRPPQIGALHAIAAHWSVSKNPALVVMPTGTGKTEVMLATMVMHQPERLLVIVPSNLLREQTFEKFIRLGVLKKAGVFAKDVHRPVAGAVYGTPNNDTIEHLKGCNVVVTTMAALSAMGIGELKHFTKLFDMVFFDEAHHLPANSWEKLNATLKDHRVLQFTATPFRLDGKRISGKIIYNFPLRLAQQQGYFREIDFIEVSEIDDEIADQKIAATAVTRLRSDISSGFQHLLLVRADTKIKAEKLFNDIYSRQYSDLNPVLIHSAIAGRREKLKAIRERKHSIIVCVDMFGEGYDLPQLKIAALHDVHKSLAVTLQFAGRFTRTAEGLGNAAVVANVADPRVSDAIEELYAEDSDWNTLIPKLSARAIESQANFSDFLQRMQPSNLGDDELFSLNVLHPKTSTVMYRATSFSPAQFRKGVKKGAHIQRVWISKEKDYLVFITRSRVPIDWASIKEATDEVWDLYVLAFDEKRSVIYLHSSQNSSLHEDLARAVGGDDARPVAGESVFRAFFGLKRINLQNVGLKSRGNKLSFHMYVGADVADMVSPTAQANAAKSNLFALGYDEGKKVSVGVSTKGRLWARTSGSIPDWREWCERIATRVLNSNLPTDEYLKYTLVPKDISELPSLQIFAIAFPSDWFSDEMDSTRLFVASKEMGLHLVGLTRWEKLAANLIEIEVACENEFSSVFQLKWGPAKGGFQVEQKSGPEMVLRERGQSILFHDYLRENPPTIFLTNGAEVNGGSVAEPHDTLEHVLNTDDVEVWDWTGVNLTVESLWKNGSRRDSSIQGQVLDILSKRANRVVIDDDDAGESADVVEIAEYSDHIVVRFYHCKYSQSANPGDRAKDLYEVCGQAVRSTRWLQDPEHLIDHLQMRAGATGLNGRTTRFAKGDSRDLIQLKKNVRQARVRFEVFVVQPGLSKNKMEPQTGTILASASNFLLEMTGVPLRAIASR